MTPCPRPLDPLDIEALASGGDSVVSEGATAHATGCPACGAAVAEARHLSEQLEGLGGLPSLPVGFTDQVLRLRPFSASERTRFALWRLPVAVAVALAGVGIVLLGAPVLTGSEQAGLGAALLAPLPAVSRALVRSAADAVRVGPASLDALAFALRQDFTVGLLLLALLLPASFGLRRVLLHARSRR